MRVDSEDAQSHMQREVDELQDKLAALELRATTSERARVESVETARLMQLEAMQKGQDAAASR